MRKTKRAAHYKSRSTGSQKCGNCWNFRSSGKSAMGMCIKVIGPVHQDGVSDEYRRKRR